MGKTAVTMVTMNAELAESYIARARSSGRCSPRRSRVEVAAIGSIRAIPIDLFIAHAAPTRDRRRHATLIALGASWQVDA